MDVTQLEQVEAIKLAIAFALADRVHMLLNQTATDVWPRMGYLTLVCLGWTDGYAASFDTSIYGDDDWYEHLEEYEFSAKAGEPWEAIEQAAQKALTALQPQAT